MKKKKLKRKLAVAEARNRFYERNIIVSSSEQEGLRRLNSDLLAELQAAKIALSRTR